MCRRLLPRKGSRLFSARTKQRLRCMASSPDTTRSMNLRQAPSIKTAEESSRARLTSSCSNSASGLTNPTEHAQVRPSLAWGSAKTPSPPVVLEYWSHCRRADTSNRCHHYSLSRCRAIPIAVRLVHITRCRRTLRTFENPKNTLQQRESK